MITSSQEYEQFLANIAEDTPSTIVMRLPTTEPVYEIDWDSRSVSAPPFIGVEGDHEAEIIYFEMDRYFDAFDLAETIGLIIFKNARQEQYYQLISSYDVYSKKDKIIFPWVVQAPAALYGGVVPFSFKFFKIDRTTKKLIFELNSKIARTKVFTAWSGKANQTYTYHTLDPQSLIVDDPIIQGLDTILETVKTFQIYWTDLDEIVNKTE